MNIKNQLVKIMFALIVAFTAFSCSDDDKQEIAKLSTINDLLKADANYSVLVKALQVSNITNFSAGGSYTLFAPDNAAFATIGITEASLTTLSASTLSADIATLAAYKRILQNHIIGVGTNMSDLLPSSTTTGYTSTSAAAVTGTFLSMYVNKPATNILINGGNAVSGGANVVRQDVDASNGIIHYVDRVIQLPKIVNLVAANPELSTLTTIVTSGVGGAFGDQTAVLAVLNGAGPITVFAPLNSAFDKATTGSGFYTGTSVTPSNTSKLLQYHVVNTNIRAASASAWNNTTDATLTTLAPTAQKFFIPKTTLKITELPVIAVPASNIKVVNIQATNGVIHTIDRVLQPVL
ncbi:fasciclin domain-containing protein [Flavobacterium sp.]|uniref:fasciclin domain-containing protein n=1 Tax=Flavobacterium sp. TaxID=239 RepID=UPI003753C688